MRRHQSSSPERNRNNRSNSFKGVSEDRRPGEDHKPSQPNTVNNWQGHNNQNTLIVISVATYVTSHIGLRNV